MSGVASIQNRSKTVKTTEIILQLGPILGYLATITIKQNKNMILYEEETRSVSSYMFVVLKVATDCPIALKLSSCDDKPAM